MVPLAAFAANQGVLRLACGGDCAPRPPFPTLAAAVLVLGTQFMRVRVVRKGMPCCLILWIIYLVLDIEITANPEKAAKARNQPGPDKLIF